MRIHSKISVSDYFYVQLVHTVGARSHFKQILRLTAILGGSKPASKCATIRIRAFSPTGFGIAKGMLMVKDNIDRVEIPKSMIKVRKSTAQDPLHDSVVLIVGAIYPSISAKKFSKQPKGTIDHDEDPVECDSNQIKPPVKMYRKVMLDAGVKKETLGECEFS